MQRQELRALVAVLGTCDRLLWEFCQDQLLLLWFHAFACRRCSGRPHVWLCWSSDKSCPDSILRCLRCVAATMRCSIACMWGLLDLLFSANVIYPLSCLYVAVVYLTCRRCSGRPHVRLCCSSNRSCLNSDPHSPWAYQRCFAATISCSMAFHLLA